MEWDVCAADECTCRRDIEETSAAALYVPVSRGLCLTNGPDKL